MAETLVISRESDETAPDARRVQEASTLFRGDQGRVELTGMVVDHFEVLEEIGCGGMGTVYRALDHSLERYVALKVINRLEIIQKSAKTVRFQRQVYRGGLGLVILLLFVSIMAASISFQARNE